MFLFGGVVKSFGILFVEYLEAYDTTASNVSLIISIQFIMSSVIGLLALTIGPLFFSHRCLTIFGGIMCSSAYIVNAFAPSISVVLVGTGILYGIGGSFTHGPATVMIGKYFEKRRGFANGAFKIGAGVGSFAFPHILRYLLDTYGLQGTLLILSGLLLNIVPCGALLRPIEFYQNSKKQDNTTEKENLMKPCVPNEEMITDKDNIKNGNGHIELFPFASSDNVSKSQYTRVRTYTDSDYKPRTEIQKSKQHNNHYLESLSLDSAVLCGSVGDVGGSMHYISKTQEEKITNVANKKDDLSEKKTKSVNIKGILKTVFNKKLLQNKLFLLFLASTSLGLCGTALINSFIPPHAKDNGISDQQSAILISIFGGADLLGRFLMAVIADHCIRRYALLAFAMMIAGGVCQIVPFLQTFWSLAAFAFVTGLCSGVYFAVIAVVLIDFVGIEHLSGGYGICQLVNGMTITIVTPLLGRIRDSTSSYIGSFYLMGCSLLMAGFLLLLKPLISRCQKKSSTDLVIEC